MTRTPSGRRLRAAGLVLSALASLAIVSAAPPAQAGGGPPVPPTPTGLPTAIEGLAPLRRAHRRPAQPGRLGQARHVDQGDVRQHLRPVAQLHVGDEPDLRALRRARRRHVPQRAQRDPEGPGERPADLAAGDRCPGKPLCQRPRLGVMYIIWNKQDVELVPDVRWLAAVQHVRHDDVNGVRHRLPPNHIHLSLSWEGAMGRTSFWTKQVAPFDWGPCVSPTSAGRWAWRHPTRVAVDVPRRQGPARREQPAQGDGAALGHGARPACRARPSRRSRRSSGCQPSAGRSRRRRRTGS